MEILLNPCAVANPVIAFRLQFTRPVGPVGELGLLGAVGFSTAA